MEICVCGWYYFKDFYEKLNQSKCNVYIVAHRYNKILNKYKFKYTIIKNIGLEFGAYDWYIKNIWDGKSNVLFMHDDIKIKKVKCLYEVFEEFAKNNIDQCYIFGERGRGPHGRCIYVSNQFIKMIIKDYKGIWFDKKNNGFIDTASIKNIENVKIKKKRYNYGIYNFSKCSKKIGKKYNLKTELFINNCGLILYYRGNNILR